MKSLSNNREVNISIYLLKTKTNQLPSGVCQMAGDVYNPKKTAWLNLLCALEASFVSLEVVYGSNSIAIARNLLLAERSWKPGSGRRHGKERG